VGGLARKVAPGRGESSGLDRGLVGWGAGDGALGGFGGDGRDVGL